jgi:hypothetical protein
MEIKRRFVFHGNAAPFSGRLVRPADVVLESSGASSLPVTGGRLRSKIDSAKFGDVIKVGSASSFVEGLFDDVNQAVEASHGRVHQDAQTATTSVNAEVREIVVGVKPQLTVARLHAALTSRSPAGSGEPAVRLGDDTVVEGAAIDGHKLVVELNAPVFQTYDTHSKLRTAADDPQFVDQHGDSLLMKSAFGGRPAPPTGRLIEGRAGIHATIVKSVRWDGEPYPGAEIDHNVVTVPNFGRIFFGEILITADARRLTMLRLELGSPDGGDAAFAEVDTNGIWSP